MDLSILEKEELNDVFVFADFVKPGVHTILVYDPLTNDLYFKQVGVRVRRAPHAAPGSGSQDADAAKWREKQLQESADAAMRK
jgi:hypothetical protein